MKRIQANEHLALIKGEWKKEEPVLVRVHSSCFTGDILGSLRCDCGDQLHTAMQMVEKEGKGVILYMNQEGRGIGLVNKLESLSSCRKMEWILSKRTCILAFQWIKEIMVLVRRYCVTSVLANFDLMSNNPRKRAGLLGYGLEVVETIPIEVDTQSTQ